MTIAEFIDKLQNEYEPDALVTLQTLSAFFPNNTTIEEVTKVITQINPIIGIAVNGAALIIHDLQAKGVLTDDQITVDESKIEKP